MITAILSLGSLHWGYNYIPLQWTIAFCLALIIAFCKLSKWIPSLPLFALCFSVFSSIISPYGDPYSALCLISTCALAWWSSETPLNKYLIPSFTALNALYVVICFLTDRGHLPRTLGWSGILDYPGLNGSLIALGVTSFFSLEKKYAFPGIVLAISGITLSYCSIPYGVLFVCLSSFIVRTKRCNLLGALPLACILAFFSHKNHALFDSSGRFAGYRVFVTDWLQRGHYLIGDGFGSFIKLAFSVQKRTGFGVSGQTMDLWPWAHSDWLQTLLETGAIGLASYLAVFVSTIKNLWEQKSSQLDMAMGLSAMAIFDYPARYFVTAFLMSHVVCVAHRSNQLTCVQII